MVNFKLCKQKDKKHEATNTEKNSVLLFSILHLLFAYQMQQGGQKYDTTHVVRHLLNKSPLN